MKTMTVAVVLVLLCQSCQAQVENVELGESLAKHTYKGLQVYPVRANDAFLAKRTKTRYLTLNEALSTGKVVVTEHREKGRSRNAGIVQSDGGSADVNKLYIENNSADTVFILGGEIVQGGKQDRTIARDLVLLPKSGKVDLDVFCVEHGRWSEVAAEETVNESPDDDRTEFIIEKQSIAPNSVRKAAMNAKSQEKVWEEVDIALSVNTVEAPTRTVNALKMEDTYTKGLTEYSKALSGVFNSDPKVIGVIAVAGDEIIACDVFTSHELFMKYYDNLLQSWASQAMESNGEVSVDKTMVVEYYDKTVRAKMKEAGFDKRGTLHLTTF